MTTTHGDAAEAAVALDDLQRDHDVVVGLFDLLNDEISGPEWLAKVARFARCSSAQCLWWPAGRPEFHREDCSGPASSIPEQSVKHLDALVRERRRAAPGFADDWAAGSALLPDLVPEVFRPDRIVMCLDWHPAPVVLVLEGREGHPDWEQSDRQRLLKLLPIIHKSLNIKKRLSWNDDIAELANKVFDEIPRGFVAMMPNRQVIIADRVARELMSKGDLLSLVDGKLELHDSALHHELTATLQAIEKLPRSSLESFAWRKNLSGRSGPDSYLAVTKGFEFDSWRRESTPYKRVAVMVMQSQQLVAPIDAGHVQDFFGLTRAQARVVVALAGGQSAEAAASSLSISVNTVRSHLRSIYAKLDVDNKAQMLHRVMSGMSSVNATR